SDLLNPIQAKTLKSSAENAKCLRRARIEGTDRQVSHKGNAMRKSVGPWFRKSKNAWYVCHEGKQVNLFVKGEANEKDAVKAWHRLMAGDDPTPTQEPTVKPEPKPTPKAEVKPDALTV